VGDKLRMNFGLDPAETLEIGSNEGIARTLAAGVGIAMLPLIVVRELILMGSLVALKPAKLPRLYRPLFRLSLAQRPDSPGVEAFRRLLGEELKAA
jgi:DNA-binding transcriptional LysR family regulator